MPTDPLLASALLGTARRPLTPADRARARELLPGVDDDRRLALALAAARSLADRVRLDRAVLPTDDSPSRDIPLREATATDDLLAAYIDATQLLTGKPDTRYFSTRGLTVPAQRLYDLLVATVGGRGAIHYSVFLALGARGRWLARQHPRFRSRVAFLDADRLPRNKWQRIPYAAVALARRTAVEDDADEKRASLPGLAGAAGGLIERSVREGVLIEALGWTAALQLALGDRPPTAAERDALDRSLHSDHWPARAAALLAAKPARASASQPFDRERFGEEAAAAIGLGDGGWAAGLVGVALASEDLLAIRHPALPGLVRLLDPGPFAELLDRARIRFPRGWRDPGLLRLFLASAHPVSPLASDEWVTDAVRAPVGGNASLAGQHPHRLDVRSVDRAAELVHDFPDSAAAAALLALLSARERLDAARPIVAVP